LANVAILEGMKGPRPASSKVLVVDDAVEIRNRLCAMLADQAHVEAVGCSTARVDALREFSKLCPGCVVIDVPVRDSTGFELVAALRELDDQCLIVVLTNHATEEFRRRSIQAGADHFLAKSTEFERVVELVHALQGEA
jgi:two-component system OmpR family response regulator